MSRQKMKIRILIIIAAFLVLLPWIHGLNFERDGYVTVDGMTYSAMIVMPITLASSLITWFLLSWASKKITTDGILLGIISGTALVLPFLDVLGPMAGILVGIPSGFVAFILQKTRDTSKNKPFVVAGTTLAVSYVVLSVIVMLAHSASEGIGEWSGTAEGMEKSGFDNIFGNSITFVFFLAIIPSLLMTCIVIRGKNEN